MFTKKTAYFLSLMMLAHVFVAAWNVEHQPGGVAVIRPTEKHGDSQGADNTLSALNQRLRECQEQGVTSIDASSCGISTLSEKFVGAHGDIIRGPMVEFPVGTRVLSLGGNPLGQLPEAGTLARLSVLESLDMSDCALDTCPLFPGSLRELDLSGNPIGLSHEEVARRTERRQRQVIEAPDLAAWEQLLRQHVPTELGQGLNAAIAEMLRSVVDLIPNEVVFQIIGVARAEHGLPGLTDTQEAEMAVRFDFARAMLPVVIEQCIMKLNWAAFNPQELVVQLMRVLQNPAVGLLNALRPIIPGEGNVTVLQLYRMLHQWCPARFPAEAGVAMENPEYVQSTIADEGNEGVVQGMLERCCTQLSILKLNRCALSKLICLPTVIELQVSGNNFTAENLLQQLSDEDDKKYFEKLRVLQCDELVVTEALARKLRETMPELNHLVVHSLESNVVRAELQGVECTFTSAPAAPEPAAVAEVAAEQN